MHDTAHPPDPTAEFDAFYKAARDRLLLQTYALTGDLGAARSAVRDAFVVAWHHWRKTSRLEDPESSVRPHAWRHAVRRASVRPWHREKGLDPDDRATLEALAALTSNQRRALLLTQLAAVSMADMAREIGIPGDVAERELQSAAAQFSTQKNIPAASIPMAFTALAAATTDVTWPRVTIIRRAGAARRRMHTVVGAGVVVAALVASGAAVTDATGVRPTLDRDQQTAAGGNSSAAPGPEIVLPDTTLLPVDDVQQTLVGEWQQGRTHDNSVGNGVVLPCQPEGERYADARGTAAYVRTFRNGPAGEAGRKVTELIEASRDRKRAEKTFERVRSWVADCGTPGVRLVSTATSPDLADSSALVVLHDQHPEPTTYVVGIARTGLFTTAVALETDVGPETADGAGIAKLLGAAVDRLCTLPDAGRCTGRTALEPVAPFPAGDVPALLAPVDLPFVGDPARPWMGTPAREITDARTELGVLGCLHPPLTGEFDGRKFRNDVLRTFVKVDKSLPAEFGLTQGVASLPKKTAGALLEDFRNAINACPDRDASAGTEVRVLETSDEGARSYTAWHLSTRLPGERTIEYSVAFLRDGDAVSELVFVSAPGARMSDAQFVELTERALQRLPQLPSYPDR
ncbi:hypothetical protein DJ010_03180 [Nocardioides silvaticus]|uniref:RNA polymerase sigma factor 70 region 4 type 2 domain-containing protein n=1 Tax=Nocardioides silvaticus TaxID=2201891 RepID=A0A316TN41_9ACTN|nr:sigma-70 family RNA polymerase sigma factor [Nocardioides silvaticus]PWN04639.1 hypothetical protein DJ010_03180 [Nocardioides silvaticus]